jgi:DNA-binding MarR family transcriptional regulator
VPLRLIPAIHRATHAIALYLEQSREHSVSQAEAHILAHLAADGAATVAEIHRTFGHKRSTLTSILDRLDARGLVTREVSPDDRRSFVVKLTRPGKTLAAKVYSHLEELELQVLGQFRKTERDAFDRIIAALPEVAERDTEHV